MLKSTASQFRKDHKIHFQASIGRTSGIPVEPHYDLAKFIWSGSHKSEVRNERTLDSLVNELGAFPRSAQWAIDVANDQFLIYSAKDQ